MTKKSIIYHLNKTQKHIIRQAHYHYFILMTNVKKNMSIIKWIFLWAIICLWCLWIYTININTIYASTGSCPWCATVSNTEVSVRLYNSYSWSIAFNSGTINRTLSWWSIRVGQPYSLIDTTASSSSTYSISGWIMSYTGQWSWVYTNPTFINLGWEWVHTLQAEFNKLWEFVYSNTLTIYTDYTAPSQPITTSIPDNTLFTASTWSLSRSPSTDTWVWLAGYLIYISLNPSFSGIVPLRVTGTNRSFASADLPSATIFYKITAIDYLGHESSSTIHYFHNQTSTLVGNGWQVYQPLPLPSSEAHTTQITSLSSSYLQKRKVLSIMDTKALKPYLIRHFVADPVDGRVLPDMLPDTGADGDLQPLSKRTIEKMINQSLWNSYCMIRRISIVLATLIGLILWWIRWRKQTQSHRQD